MSTPAHYYCWLHTFQLLLRWARGSSPHHISNAEGSEEKPTQHVLWNKVSHISLIKGHCVIKTKRLTGLYHINSVSMFTYISISLHESNSQAESSQQTGPVVIGLEAVPPNARSGEGGGRSGGRYRGRRSGICGGCCGGRTGDMSGGCSRGCGHVGSTCSICARKE